MLPRLFMAALLVTRVVASVPVQAWIEYETTDSGGTSATMESSSNPGGVLGEGYRYRKYASVPPEISGSHIVTPSMTGVDYEVIIECVNVDCTVSGSEGWYRSHYAPDSDCTYHVKQATGFREWAETETGSGMTANLNALEYIGTC